MDYLDSVLTRAIELRASDIHLRTGVHPVIRVDGRLVYLGEIPPVSAAEIDRLAERFLTEAARVQVRQGQEVDVAFAYRDTIRFRVNAFKELRGIGFALRTVPQQIPDAAKLGIPDAMRAAVRKPHGLVLVAGPTGSGKSTTVASLIEHINANDDKHIITFEDTIEFVHENKRSLITQRAVGIGENSVSFPQALNAALREDPDVLMIGDMRDRETIALGLTAAETGHLVIAQIHSSTTYHALNRMLGSFLGEAQQQVREQLAQQLIAISAQRLIPLREGGRILAAEVLLNSTAVRAQIRDNNIQAIADTIRTSRRDGMILFENRIEELIRQGGVDESQARSAVMSS